MDRSVRDRSVSEAPLELTVWNVRRALLRTGDDSPRFVLPTLPCRKPATLVPGSGSLPCRKPATLVPGSGSLPCRKPGTVVPGSGSLPCRKPGTVVPGSGSDPGRRHSYHLRPQRVSLTLRSRTKRRLFEITPNKLKVMKLPRRPGCLRASRGAKHVSPGESSGGPTGTIRLIAHARHRRLAIGTHPLSPAAGAGRRHFSSPRPMRPRRCP